MKTRVVVVDDHPVYRQALVLMLENGSQVEVVGEAEDGATALEVVEATQPDVVLMDIRMPGMDGIEATRQIRHRHPKVKVLALSAFDDENYVLEMVKAGAAGYMLKDADHVLIASGIEAVYQGKARMHPRLALTVLNAFAELSTSASRHANDYDGLSERELEILRLLAMSDTNTQIARRLWISGRTVDNHVQNIYHKLKVSSRVEATLYAVRKGLIGTGG